AALVIADCEAVDIDIIRVQDLEGPQVGALEGQRAGIIHVVGILDQGQPNAFSVVVGGPAEPFGRVLGAQVVVTLPPDGPVLVDGAFAGERDVVRIADVDHCGRPGHLDSGDAGG